MGAPKIAIFDKLGGELKNYVDEYQLAKKYNRKIDYEISSSIMNGIAENEEKRRKGLEKMWYIQIFESENVNYLPDYLQELIRQYMPIFIENNPQYKDEECLKFSKT